MPDVRSGTGQAAWARAAQKGTVYNRSGQAIRYRICGDAGPVLLLFNAFWSGTEGWEPLVRALRATHRLVLWEYAEAGSSGDRSFAGALGVPSFADDALCLLDGAGMGEAVLVGQGLGVQVALELYRLQPHRARSIIALCGADAGPLSPWIPSALDESLSRAVERLVLPVGVPLWKMLRAFWRAYEPPHENAPAPEGRAAASAERAHGLWLERIGRTDPRVGLQILSSMLFHRTGGSLCRAGVPVLIVGGDQDRLVTPARLRKMARRFPDARIAMLPGCSHRALQEDPESVCRHVRGFLMEQGLG